MIDKSDLLIKNLLKILTILFFCILTYYFSLSNEGSGDEQVFLDNLSLIKTKGWYEAISQKIGLTYIILAYPFTFLFQDYIALRIVNVLLFIILFFYFTKMGSIKNEMFYYYFFFFAASGWFMLGTNDTLFYVCLVCFFNEVYKILEDKDKINLTLMWCSLIIAFFTRQLIYLYVPIIFFSFFLIYRKRNNLLNKIKKPILLFAICVIINIPSLLKNKNFSYDNKVPPKTIKSNWIQRQYLAQLMVNNGELENKQHPSWQVTDEYLLKNGLNSLPNSFISSMLFDIESTLKECFKNLADIIFQSIRQTGLVILFLFSYFSYCLFRRKITINHYLPFISIVLIFTFSIVIFSFVEMRWLTPILIMSLVYYSDLEFNNKLHKLFLITNNLFFILIIFYGTYKVLNKF